MTIDLLCNLPTIKGQIQNASHLMLGLDYDGTMAPIVANPKDAILSKEAHDILHSLVTRPNLSVAIVSGRNLHDLRSFVDIEKIFYAGNHGFEIEAGTYRFVEPRAAKLQSALNLIAKSLSRELKTFSEIFVENKSLSLTVHVRGVAQRHLLEVRERIKTAMEIFPKLFQIRSALESFEVRPNVTWHKGYAVRWILAHLAAPKALPIYLGDDVTDEDVFLELMEGLTVKVGGSRETAARFRVSNPGQVIEFLCWLDSVVSESASAR